ncbi:MAG: tRNA (cytidine(34)-2'-O)-methyltransferase [Oscillatoriales cyanobacterium RM2_1_1]|nr:tRNA (cytidine(34)-2'-O)-methyltransferase [Oscillatoriales cyanobacterium SM2_3_0]NJO46893.1 tRNA (cytidine(34)-2'-O)-methyltransferase [Oscillatoriales cyanobacterium RM2_1_1]
MPRIVLIQPQIPPNTGNIARTCAATRTELHLVGPLGFEMGDRDLKRAGLDYWPYVPLKIHPTLKGFRRYCQLYPGRWIGFSTRGNQIYSRFQYHVTDWLLFGRETTGLSSEVLEACTATVYIPMAEPGVRSLNLSVSVTAGLFEARRSFMG